MVNKLEKCLHPMLAKRDQKWFCHKIQAEMQKQGLGYLILQAPYNVFYATGYTSLVGSSAAVIPAEGDVHLLISTLESAAIIHICLDLIKNTPMDGKVGIEMGSVTHHFYTALTEALPEGMVVGLAAALALRGEPEAVSGALALALGIGLQNIPEGAAVSLPLAQAGQGRRKAFCAGAASGLVEPLGALLALALAGWVSAALPWLMSAAAGCMVCVTAQEMIPEAVGQDEPAGVVSVVLGFALMMALDIAL